MGKVVDKLISGKYFSIVCFTITLCYISLVEPSVRDAFFALAGGLLRDYYQKDKDKKEEAAKEVKPSVTN